jgi:Glycosyl hydrolase family 26
VAVIRTARLSRRAWTIGLATAVALGAGLVVLGVLGSGPFGGGSPSSGNRGGPSATAHGAAPRGLYWGAWIGDQLTGTEAPFDMTAVARFERLAGGKGLSLIQFSSPFENCYENPCASYAFPAGPFEKIRRYGAIPLFSWGSNALPVRSTAARFSLARIIRGDYDAYVRTWARAAARWGHPFLLRFDWEMNGKWFPWGWGSNGNRPGEFIGAWQRVHRIFASAGATNATWVWCPNVDPAGVFGPLRALYPGAAYVDWTCVDVYNRNAPWTSFDGLFDSTYTALEQLAPGKPMLIAEIGSTEDGGSKAAWITGLLRNLSGRYPLVRGLAWFEKYGSGFDWPIETSTASRRAFADAIASPLYRGNTLAALSGGAVRPPK